MNTYCIYMHVNKINGKKYIGMTKHGNNPNKRWCNGRAYTNYKLFGNDIQKYGWNNFHHLIIENNLSYEEAKEKEKKYVIAMNSNNEKYGYNIKIGYLNSEESKKKMSEIKKGKKASDATKKKMSEIRKGMPVLEEARKKISIANKGRRHTEESKLKMSKSRKGKPISGKTCIIIYNNEKFVTNSCTKMRKLFHEKYGISCAHWLKGRITMKYIDNIQLIQNGNEIIYKKEGI